MGREISIAISAKDNFTQAITTMRNANSSFNKDLTGLSSKLDALNKNKVTLKVDTDKAKFALKDAEKQFSATGSAADKMALELAGADYDNAKRNLDLVSKNARQAEKDILSMTDAVSKADNRAGSGKNNNVLNSLAQAGLTKMVGDSVSQLANTAVSSAFGSNAGNIFGSTLSGAATGAAMGSLAGPVGTAVGAAVGAGVGALNAANSIYQEKDSAFKSVVQENYNNAKQVQDEALSNGSTIAGNREQKQISFATLLGSDSTAKDYLAKMTDFAAKTPFQYDQLATMSKTMLAYGYKVDELIPELTKIGDAGSALSMTGDDMNYVATSLGRMKTTGKTTLEYLNPLLERGIPVWDYLSKASGKTKEQVQEMVSKGLVPGAQAAKAISDYMGKSFTGNMEKQAKTYQGLQSSLEDAQDSMNAAMGTGYNNERKKGLEAQIDWLGGSSGTKMQDAYSMIGSWKASLDNTHEQAVRDAMDKMMQSDDYKKAAAQNNQVEMGKLLAQAQVQGENEYKSSEGYQLQIKSDLDLATSIRNDTSLKSEYWNTGYEMGQQFSTGLATGALANKPMMEPSQYLKNNSVGSGNQSGELQTKGTNSQYSYLMQNASGHATGIFRVPYNNFPALLHEGETVNTAVEARSRKSGGIVINNYAPITVREKADVDKIARSFVEQVKRAALIS